MYGSFIHRDQIWVTHFLAVLAVCAAVSGVLHELGTGHEHKNGFVWPLAEVAILLAIIFSVSLLRHRKLQERWTACRLGAEQMRIARLCIPLLIVPRALSSVDAQDSVPASNSDHALLSLRALSEVKRAVRDHGLPSIVPGNSPRSAGRWLNFILNGQVEYHARNHRRLEMTERRLQTITRGIFGLVLIAALSEVVVVYFLCENKYSWLLYPTAAGPALAGAIHGAATRLGLAHRIELSRVAEAELKGIQGLLQDLIFRNEMADDWGKLRELAAHAAEAMGRENTSWHGLVRLQPDDLPA